MADEEGKTGQDPNQDGKDQDGAGSGDSGSQGDDAAHRKKLEEATTEELIAYIKELRTEAKTRRLDGEGLQEKYEALLTKSEEAAQKIKALEQEKLTDAEKEAERVKVLEAEAAKMPSLERYRLHVEEQYKERMKEVEKLDKDVKKSINDLIADMSEDDFLGRLKAVNAVLAVTGKRDKVPDGDEGHPGETGGGDSGRTLDSNLAWSPLGQQEAAMAGLTKKSSD